MTRVLCEIQVLPPPPAGGPSTPVEESVYTGTFTATIPANGLYDTVANPLVISPVTPGLVLFVHNASAVPVRVVGIDPGDPGVIVPALVTCMLGAGTVNRIVLIGGAAVYPSRFFLEPGNPNPVLGTYTTWEAVYTAAILVPGSKIIQISDKFQSPVIIPPGTYALDNIVISGDIESPSNTQVKLSDGVIFSSLGEVTNKITLINFNTTTPVHEMTDGDFFIASRGAGIRCDVTATQPFFHVSAGLVQAPLFVFILGGVFEAGNTIVSVDAGASVGNILCEFAGVANNTIDGAGDALMLVASQAAFVNTPYPIVQPIATLQVIIYSYADWTSFHNLDPAPWAGPAPADVESAINRMATLVQTLNGGAPIP